MEFSWLRPRTRNIAKKSTQTNSVQRFGFQIFRSTNKQFFQFCKHFFSKSNLFLGGLLCLSCTTCLNKLHLINSILFVLENKCQSKHSDKINANINDKKMITNKVEQLILVNAFVLIFVAQWSLFVCLSILECNNIIKWKKWIRFCVCFIQNRFINQTLKTETVRTKVRIWILFGVGVWSYFCSTISYYIELLFRLFLFMIFTMHFHLY